jgi:hypothetical protein
MAMIGITNVKFISSIVNCQEQIRKQDLPYVYTANSSIASMTTVVFCIYILLVNKDSILFM